MPVLRSNQRGICLCFDPVKGEYACVAIQSKGNMPVLRSNQRGICLCYDPIKGEYACVTIQSAGLASGKALGW